MFEKVIISSEAGADKPAPHIFEHALGALNVPAANALHVGDDPARDWAAAAAAGMRVYKLERPGNSLTGLIGSFEVLISPPDILLFDACSSADSRHVATHIVAKTALVERL